MGSEPSQLSALRKNITRCVGFNKRTLNDFDSCTPRLFVHSLFFLIKNIARICTLVKVFLLPVVPQPKLYFVTTHLIKRMRVKSLSSPGICCLRPAAFFIPPANRFHTRILANICYLALHQGFSMRYWNLAFWFNFKITDKIKIIIDDTVRVVP